MLTAIIPAMEPGVNTLRWRAGRIRDVFPFALTLVCAGALCFLSGGFIFTRSAPVAIVYLLAAALWVWFLRRRTAPSPLFLVTLAAFGLFVAWTGLSVLWSLGPDRSWMAFDVAALYLCVLGVVGLTPAGPLQLRVAGFGFLVVCVAVGVYALLGKVTPDVVTHAHLYARLTSPVGYWNVLALLMVMGFVVALSLAGDPRAHPSWRVIAAVAGVPLLLTFFYSLSRGGWVALAVALAFYFALSTSRLSSFVSLAVMVAPGAAVAWGLRGLSTLVTATTDDALRTAEGHTLLRWTLVALAVTGALQALVVLAQRLVPWPPRARLVAGVAVVFVLVGVASVGSWRFLEPRGATRWIEDRLHTFIAGDDETYAHEGTSRLISLNTGRPPLWREALQQSRSARAAGTGADTFVFTHERFRENGAVVKDAHSQWFNVLSELGVVGLVLFVAAMALVVASAVRNPFRDRGDPLRPLVVALQAGVVAFIVHISWDWDWDMAAVTVVFLLFAATCSTYLATRRDTVESAVRGAAASLGAGAGGVVVPSGSARTPIDESQPLRSCPGPDEPHRRSAMTLALRVGASTALVVLVASWLFPYLSLRAEQAAATASSRGDPAAALGQVQRAERLNPLAADPLVTQALLLQHLGRNGEALETLRRAERLQPDYAKPYFYEGVLLLTAFDDREGAIAALTHALALNPFDRLARYELEQAFRR